MKKGLVSLILLSFVALAIPGQTHAQAPHPYHPSADMNLDGEIDILDLSYVSNKYGSSHPNADIDGNGRVDILDLIQVSSRYGTEIELEPTSSPQYERYEAEIKLASSCNLIIATTCLSSYGEVFSFARHYPSDSYIILADGDNNNTVFYKSQITDVQWWLDFDWEAFQGLIKDGLRAIPDDGYGLWAYPPREKMKTRDNVFVTVYTKVPGGGWIRSTERLPVWRTLHDNPPFPE